MEIIQVFISSASSRLPKPNDLLQAIQSFVLFHKKFLAWSNPAAMRNAGRVWHVTVVMPEAAVP